MSSLAKLVAHRGYAAKYPENTLIGMEAALRAGACYLECDIQLSRDGVAMVHHDSDLLRSAGRAGALWDYDAVELQRICVNEPERFPGQYDEVFMATLEELVSLLQKWPEAQLFVELKEESLERFGMERMVAIVLETLQPVLQQCIMISFDWESIHHVKQLGSIRTGWVLAKWDEEFHKKAVELAPDFLFTNVTRFPEEGGWPGDWQWAIYEITDPRVAIELAGKGVALVESFAVGEMLQHELLQGWGCHDSL